MVMLRFGWCRCSGGVIFSHRLYKIEILCFDGTDCCKKVSDTYEVPMVYRS